MIEDIKNLENLNGNEINKSLHSDGNIEKTVKIIQNNINILNDKIDLCSDYFNFITNVQTIKIEYNTKASLTCFLQILILIMMSMALTFVHNIIGVLIINFIGLVL